MRKKETSYTIKEIVEAWEKFTQPIYLVDNKKITEETLKNMEEGSFIQVNDLTSIKPIEVDYSLWINYLISEKWKANK